MRETVGKRRVSLWRHGAIVLFLSFRRSVSYVPVELLTAPSTSSRCPVSQRRSFQGRKRSRVECNDSLIRFAVQMDQGVNETVMCYPNNPRDTGFIESEHSVNGSSKPVPYTRNGSGVNGESTKRKNMFLSSQQTRKPPDKLLQTKVIKKNGSLKSEASYADRISPAEIENDMARLSFDCRKQKSLNSSDPILEDLEERSLDPVEKQSIRRLWSKRHARTLEEGIRRETAPELYALLHDAQIEVRTSQGRRYVERTFMGLVNALAEEHEDLDIDISTVGRSPLWRKEVKELRLNFSRLGFKPIRLGGNEILGEGEDDRQLSLIETADEAFDRIDKDKSGTLDREELAEALSLISDLETDKESIEELASKLVGLYDFNGDGAVDREEYQQMVDDMAILNPESEEEEQKDEEKEGPLKGLKKSVQSISQGISEKAAKAADRASQVASAVRRKQTPIEPDPPAVKEYGSIVLSNLKLDLRRLVFGGIPLVKHVAPGGPLILEPFSVTLNGAFTREDVMGSFLLDAGLKLLVARSLRVRARSFRDVVDGALFFGRKYKLNSKTAPMVQVLGLSNVEFDKKDKMIITGRAKLRTSNTAPIITQTFKLRTKIGTGRNGQNIKLVEPELAFVFECPQGLENAISTVFEKLGKPPPKRPEPIYSFFPIYSPYKVDENAGYDMGEDNRLKRIFIKDGKLRLEMTSVLRPGRFLGNHYLAFTVPQRTFIITLDRVKDGMRAARKNKKIAEREKKLMAKVEDGYVEKEQWTIDIQRFISRFKRKRSEKKKRKQAKPKSFFTRFVEGYTLVERENERLTSEISDWFGRQGQNRTRTAEV